MSVYLVAYLDRDKHSHIDAKIAEYNKDDCYQIQGNIGWLIAFKGTSQELFDDLCNEGSKDSPVYKEGVIITLAESYSGFAHKEMWEWLKSRSERNYVPSR